MIVLEKELGVVINGVKSSLWGAVQQSGLPGPVVVLILEGMIYNIDLGEARKKIAAVKDDLLSSRDRDGECEKVDGGES